MHAYVSRRSYTVLLLGNKNYGGGGGGISHEGVGIRIFARILTDVRIEKESALASFFGRSSSIVRGLGNANSGQSHARRTREKGLIKHYSYTIHNNA